MLKEIYTDLVEAIILQARKDYIDWYARYP